MSTDERLTIRKADRLASKSQIFSRSGPCDDKTPSISPKLVILVPCFNEEPTIGKVIDDFKAAAPTAEIYVFDNNSTDQSAEIASQRGANVAAVSRQGKGNVVRSMLSHVNSDVYVLVDGDDTYPAQKVNDLIRPILDGRADMVVGARVPADSTSTYRPLHEFGNRFFCWLIGAIFGLSLRDVLSGYRAFNDKVAKGLPVVSSGFEVEAEMTIQCMYYDFTLKEIEVPYFARPEESPSKLNTFRDGLRIFLKVLHLLRAYKPLTFFGSLALVFFVLALADGTANGLLAHRSIEQGFQGTNTLTETLVVLGGVFASTGIILHTFNYRIKELHAVFLKDRRYRF